MIVAMTSWIFVMRIISEFGSEAVAGATIAIRIMMFSMMPAWGMSNAVATLVGQNLGAQKPDRAERSVWITGFWNMAFLVIVALVYFSTAKLLSEYFTNDSRCVFRNRRNVAEDSFLFLFRLCMVDGRDPGI
jgi:Na+-driven multidrug efflux pump